jgi:hypothetical protein
MELVQGYVSIGDLNLGLVYITTLYVLLFDALSPLEVEHIVHGQQRKSIEAQIMIPMKSEFDDYCLDLPDTEQRRLNFCLELSCYLLEASYQTYFNADERVLQQEVTLHPIQEFPSYQNSIQSTMGPSLDVGRLGMKLRDVFHNDHWSTFGYLSEIRQSDKFSAPIELHRDEFVVSFRGSTLANITTDLKFSQQPLPLFSSDDLQHKFAQYLSGNASTSNYLKRAQQAPTAAPGARHLNFNFESFMKGLHFCADGIPYVNQSFPRVHSGFWEAYVSLREQYLSSIVHALYHHFEQSLQQVMLDSFNEDFLGTSRTADNKDQRMGCRIFICGHSLGGAMAVLAALELSMYMDKMLMAVFTRLAEVHHLTFHDSHNYVEHETDDLFSSFSPTQLHLTAETIEIRGFRFQKPSVVVYAYGCPRVGNPAFAHLFEKHVKTCYRVNVDGDLVTMIPKIFGFYRHVGIATLIDEDEKGDMILNPSVIEHNFFRRSFGGFANHRLDKYRSCLEACFEPDEYEEYLHRERSSFTCQD